MSEQGYRRILLLQKGLDKLISIPLVLLCLAILIISGLAILNERLVVSEADFAPSLKRGVLSPDTQYPSIRQMQQEINPEIVAWLTLQGTSIDTPITYTTDNSKYLNTTYDNRYAISGNPFFDFRNRPLMDDYSVIYGHRMVEQKMFGGVVNYADQNYLNNHLKGTLTLAEGTFALEVVAYSVEALDSTIVYDFAKYQNGKNAELLEEILGNATSINERYRDMGVAAPKQLILLSACDKDSKHYRDVLLLAVGDEL